MKLNLLFKMLVTQVKGPSGELLLRLDMIFAVKARDIVYT